MELGSQIKKAMDLLEIYLFWILNLPNALADIHAANYSQTSLNYVDCVNDYMIAQHAEICAVHCLQDGDAVCLGFSSMDGLWKKYNISQVPIQNVAAAYIKLNNSEGKYSQGMLKKIHFNI